MLYVVLLELDSSLCGGGGGVAAFRLNTMSFFICLDLMMLNPLLPIAGRLAT